MTKFLGAACATIALMGAAPAMAAELVTNGGFETGNFSGYTVTGSGSSGVYSNVGNAAVPSSSQSYRAAFAGSSVTLYQDIVTTAGQTYNFGFTNEVDAGGTSNLFSASFGGNVVYSQSNVLAGMGFTPRSFGVTATSALTRVSFTFASQGGYQNFDNVTVTPVPEPATWALMLFGFGGLGYAMRRKQASARIRFA